MMSELTILLIEDDDVDIQAVKRGFRARRIANQLFVAHDATSAWNLIRGTGGETRLVRPFIILLDLNLPGKSGLEFLEELRSDPDHRDCIVFVLTTSDDDADKLQAFDLNVAGYILKSEPADGFLDAIMLLDHYWRVVELPVT